MHALGSPLRWDVMRKLALDGPQSVTSLGGLMDRAQDSMSRHLTVLWQTGAVVGIEPPDGDTHKQFYAIPPARLRTVPGGKEIDYGVCVLRFP
jgi:predicted transcriptional regulator